MNDDSGSLQEIIRSLKKILFRKAIVSSLQIRRWCLFHPAENCHNIPILLEWGTLLPSAIRLSYLIPNSTMSGVWLTWPWPCPWAVHNLDNLTWQSWARSGWEATRQERSLNSLLQPGSPRAPLLTSHTAVCPSPPRKYSDISIDGYSSDSKATERDFK